MKTILTFCLTFFFSAISVNAQFYWKNYTTENLFNDFEQIGDDMWIATQGGLIKYNMISNEREVFQSWNSPLKGSEITSLAKSNDGSLWVGTNGGGIFNYLDGIWTRYHDFVDVDYSTVINIKCFENGDVWFLLQKGGCSICHKLFRIKNSNVEEFEGFDVKPNGSSFISFEIKDDENLWIISFEKVSIYNIPQRKVSLNYESSIFKTNDNTRICTGGVDNSGHLIVSSEEGIYKFNGIDWDLLRQPGIDILNTLKDNNGNVYLTSYLNNAEGIRFLKVRGNDLQIFKDNNLPPHQYNPFQPILYYVDDNENLYFQILRDPDEVKVWKLNNNSWIPIETQITPLNSNYMRKIISDCDNNAWLCSYGCNLLNENEWSTIQFTDSTSFHIGDIEIDPNTCGIWASNAANSWEHNSVGLVYLKDGNRTPYLFGHSNVYEVEVDNNGIVYVNSQASELGILKDGVWRWYNKNNSVIKSSIYNLTLDQQNNLYITTRDQGLLKFDGTSFYFLGYGHPDAKRTSNVFVDNDGQIWMTNDIGLVMFNGIDWIDYSHFYPEESGLSSMVQDKTGNYWISTRIDGLHYWDKEKIIKYNIENSGLRSNRILDVHLDQNNTVWLTEGIGATSLSIYDNVGRDKVTGTVYFDKDKSGDYNNSIEQKLPGQKVLLKESQNYTYSNSEGLFTHYINENGDNANLEIQSIAPWISTTNNNVEISVPQNEEVSFGLYTENLPKKVDLSIASSLPICFTDFNVWLTLINKGFEPINGDLQVTFDESLSLLNVSPGMNLLNDTTLTLNIQDLKFLEGKSIILTFMAPNEMSLGEEIKFHAIFQSNNLVTETVTNDTILCSYDPNDKKAEPTGDYFQNHFLIKDPINYTIRFENEGNYKATNIIIVDTLDEDLNLESFEFLSSSHPCDVIIERNRIVKFIFNNINLPAKGEFRAESQGYVNFKILPNSDVIDFTSIENTGHIFFDSNPAIVTNTTSTILVHSLQILDTDEDNTYSGVKIFPNPSNGVFRIEIINPSNYSIYSELGQELRSGELNEIINNIDVKLNSGFYILKVNDEISKTSYISKLIIR